MGRVLLDVVKFLLEEERESENTRLEKLDDEMLDEDAGWEPHGEMYGQIERSVGAGPYRIGEPLKGLITNDLYGMIFVSCFRAEYVLELKRKQDASEDLDAKVIENYKAKKRKELYPQGVQVREDKQTELPPTKA